MTFDSGLEGAGMAVPIETNSIRLWESVTVKSAIRRRESAWQSYISPISMAAHIHLRPISPEGRPCKTCGCATQLFGEVDFNRSCEECRGLKLPFLGVPVHHLRCTGCGLLFTDCFDDWTESEFKQFIYNEGYAKVDPDYLEIRPAGTFRDAIRGADYDFVEALFQGAPWRTIAPANTVRFQ
jgi:hypothetical protein